MSTTRRAMAGSFAAVFYAAGLIRSAAGGVPCSNSPSPVTSTLLKTYRDNYAQRIWGMPWQLVLSQRASPATEEPASNSEIQRIFGSAANGAASSTIITVQTKATISLQQPLSNFDTNTFTNGQQIIILSTIYLFKSKHVDAKYNNKIVILHQGHWWNFRDSLKENFDPLIKDLLAKGFSVAALRMPMCDDVTTCSGPENHGLITQSHLAVGSSLQFFMNPVLEFVNYIKLTRPHYNNFAMVGLSGGAWTTLLYSALDNRIGRSFIVNGPYPFYPNNVEEAAMSVNDDQCEYLTLYAMAAADSNRESFQIQSRYDPYFGQAGSSVPTDDWAAQIAAYGIRIQATINGLTAPGKFHAIVYDSGTTVKQVHQIPQYEIDNLIMPALLQPWP